MHGEIQNGCHRLSISKQCKYFFRLHLSWRTTVRLPICRIYVTMFPLESRKVVNTTMDYVYLMTILWLYPLMLQTTCVPGLSQKGLCVHHRLWLVSSQQLLLITLTTTPVLQHHRDLSRTAISLLQHPTQQFPCAPRAVSVIDNNFQGQRAPSPLPDAYTLVNPVALPSYDPLVPPVAASVQLQPPTE